MNGKDDSETYEDQSRVDNIANVLANHEEIYKDPSVPVTIKPSLSVKMDNVPKNEDEKIEAVSAKGLVLNGTVSDSVVVSTKIIEEVVIINLDYEDIFVAIDGIEENLRGISGEATI